MEIQRSTSQPAMEPAAIEQDVMFTDPVYLAFDPLQLPASDPVREIFADQVARTVWLTWRPRHLVSKSFADEVLLVAGKIKAARPRSIDELHHVMKQHIFQQWTSAFRCPSLPAWCEQAFPYLTGEPLAWAIYRPEAA